MKKRFALLLSIIIFLLSIFMVGCSSEEVKNNGKEKVITDLLGREVKIKENVERVVAIGPGALRLYIYVGGKDKIVGIEEFEKKNAKGRPYIIANKELIDLPVVGLGGPNNPPDPEKIVAVKPDVIFTTYAKDKAEADNLQNKTGIPVIAISYGKTSLFDNAVNESLRLIGKVINKEERANQVVDFIENAKKDLEKRTADIKDENRPTVYIGALGMKGMHGIESTQGKYSLFTALNIKNLADETGKTGSVMIDKEKLVEWNPNIIFIDLGGLEIVKQDYSKNTKFYDSLTAFKEGNVYSQLPYNFYSTNIDTALVNAYFIGKTVYPERFNDINIKEKAEDIYKFFVGKELFDKMQGDFGELGKLDMK
ncbi:iron ABC transporter substrate-binding protein [Caloramator proteoclasticus]|uniref:Iron complex transport system substrate-binding protein n=1 Tax=Caloramator proteoclasticus DSM 10124 TaxID=1121262 RepID=A0A1M4XTW7_9CLOT|nr:iron ABC transporter substrate-binding protein [Caloramator proteoclasticus]SHE97044.1 iron complex transport system substrate-binding protein [Caloramator proteoclasticus DSM 10124]